MSCSIYSRVLKSSKTFPINYVGTILKDESIKEAVIICLKEAVIICLSPLKSITKILKQELEKLISQAQVYHLIEFMRMYIILLISKSFNGLFLLNKLWTSSCWKLQPLFSILHSNQMIPLTASGSAICITPCLVFVCPLPLAWSDQVSSLPNPTHSFNQQIFLEQQPYTRHYHIPISCLPWTSSEGSYNMVQ